MTNDILGALFHANLAGVAAILLILMLRGPVRTGLGAAASYRLWLAPPLLGLASILPFPQGATTLVPLVFEMPKFGAPVSGPGGGVPWPTLALAVWAAGVVASAAWLAIRQMRFVAGLGVLRPVVLGGRRVMRSARSDAGPAVVGAAIVVPADFEDRFTAREQEAILAHEAQHLARGDVTANAFAALVQCLCWFNPLVHLAARRARIDQELACDAAVLEGRPGLRRSYAEALLKTQILAEIPPVGCAWLARSPHPLKARIAMLLSPPPTRLRRCGGAALLGVLVLGGGYAAWAAQPSSGRTIVQPDWVQRPDGHDMVRFYPPEAVRLKLQGEATIQCRVAATGALGACKLLRQSPQGAGFGEAAMKMTPLFRMKPMTRDGAPVAGAVVRIPVAFRLAK